jgi:FMN phosphatase YigB (HAD superfamily)
MRTCSTGCWSAYAYVERELDAEPSQFCMIACHTWDTLGAVAAGWDAALIKRVGNNVLEGRPAAVDRRK